MGENRGDNYRRQKAGNDKVDRRYRVGRAEWK